MGVTPLADSLWVNTGVKVTRPGGHIVTLHRKFSCIWLKEVLAMAYLTLLLVHSQRV